MTRLGAQVGTVGGWSAHFLLSDAQWDAIARSGGLPDEARPFLEQALELYRLESGSPLPPPNVMRRKLRIIAERADDLLCALMNSTARGALSNLDEAELINITPGALSRILSGCKDTAVLVYLTDMTFDVTLEFARQCWAIGRLRIAAERAARALPRSSGAAAAAERNSWFVGKLDAILFRFTGRRVSRSKKKQAEQQYVGLSFRAVNPGIGDGSIDEAMKSYIKARRLRTSHGEIKSKKDS